MNRQPTYLLSTLFLLLMSQNAQAQDGFVPQMHDVSGVASDDTLNIRAEPAGSAPILGELPHDATGIEVLGLNEAGTWGRIGAGEIDGWVSMNYMAERPFPPGDIPDGMRCLGNEPFWSMEFQGGAVGFATPEGNWPDLPVTAAPTRIPPGNQLFGFDATSPEVHLTGVIEAAFCSDGMSDRSYGWRIVLLRQLGDAVALETGCCKLDQR